MTDVAPHTFISNTGPVLLITEDPTITETVKQMVADHGSTFWDHTMTTLPSPARWAQAGVALVGVDAQPTVASLRERFPRRERVVLIAMDLDDATIWRKAVDIGAEHVVHLPDGTAWLNDKIAQASESEDPYCRWCQLPRSNALHNPLAQASEAHNAAVKTRDEAQKKVRETAVECIKIMAQNDNPNTAYVSFTYSNEYFGHGQSGPSVNAGHLFDATFHQVPVIDEGDDSVYWDSWDDGGFIYSVVDDLQTSDVDVYLLDLKTGIVLDVREENITLHEHEDDDE